MKRDATVRGIAQGRASAAKRTLKKNPKKALPSIAHRSFNATDAKNMGVDPKYLKEYETSMEYLVKNGVIPGCASIVFRKGHVIHAGTWGYADIEKRTPFAFDTYCRIYCATKSFIAAAFMTLVDDGLASPDDHLEKYLPAFSNLRVRVEGSNKTIEAKGPILLKHLMSHSSGIGYPPELGEEPENEDVASYLRLQHAVQKGNIRTLKSFVDNLATIPLMSQPGHKYNYGFSFDVLGRVLEIITGRSLDKVLEERLFEPLGMHDTKWACSDSELHRLAALYAKAKTWGNLYADLKGHHFPKTPRHGLLRIDGNDAAESHWRKGQETRVLAGGGFMGYLYGGLISTVHNIALFVQMLANHGVGPNGHRLLRKSTVAAMERNRCKRSVDGDSRVCYLGNIGVFREGDEYGMGGAACTYWSIDRADDTATVWFTQHLDMPELDEVDGLNHKKADLWGQLHRAVASGSKRSRRR